MKKLLSKTAALCIALASVFFVAACGGGDDAVPPSSAYLTFHSVVEQEGGLTCEKLDDDTLGEVDIRVNAGASSISFTFQFSTDSAFHMAFIDFYEDFSRLPHCNYYENYRSPDMDLNAKFDFDVWTEISYNFEAEMEMNETETALSPTDDLYGGLKNTSETALKSMCVWVSAIVSVKTNEVYDIFDICPPLGTGVAA